MTRNHTTDKGIDIMFTVHCTKPSGVCLFEGTYDACMTLALAMESFPSDVVCVEVVDNDCNIKYKWVSTYWA